jgi:predicted dienelactone hydrolase
MLNDEYASGVSGRQHWPQHQNEGQPDALGQNGLRRWAKVLLHQSRRWGQNLLVGGGLAILAARPATAAEKIYFQYGPALRSLQITSLEEFAQTGTIESDLEFYFRILNTTEPEQELFRQALQTGGPVDPLLVDKFLYSDFGEEILTGLGNIVQTRAGLNGKSSLRAALILASLEPEGLTLLNFFQELPTDLQIDLAKVRELQQAIERIVDGTIATIDNMKQLSAEEIASESTVDYDALPDLTETGPYGVQQSRLNLQDTRRDREFYVDILQPQPLPPGPIPVVIYSHGLGDLPESYRVGAEHLASYGFVVAMPQHPGSDLSQRQAFESGLSDQIYQLNEFIDRPLDVSYLLDYLEAANPETFQGRLDLNHVGMGGHSFGGYTALALAGATLDFEYLTEQCSRRFRYLNVSLLLQCDALKLPPQPYDFHDPRITSVAVKNPVNSSVFGPDGLAQVDIPILVAAGSHDPATPAVFEQFITFPWLTATPSYLLLMEGQAHVDISALDVGVSQTLSSIDGLNLAPSQQLEQYSKALSLAFYQTYTARKPDYRLYLRAGYAAYLSQAESFKIYMISERSGDQLVEPLEDAPLIPDGPVLP